MARLTRHWRAWVVIGLLTDGVLLVASPHLFRSSNVTIAATESFEALDGSPRDADGAANGIFTVAGNLTLAPGGRITCGERGPCAIRLAVGGNLEMMPASAIVSDFRSGAGGPIEIAVGGSFRMRGSRDPVSRAILRTGASDAASGGPIEVYAVGRVVTEPGSAIASEAAKDGGEIAITAAETDIRGALTARATTPAGHPGAITLVRTNEAAPAGAPPRS
jgi:hypothetical protein